MEETQVIVQRSEYRGLPQFFCASCLSTENLEFKSVRSSGSLWSDAFEVSVPLCPHCARRSAWLRPLGMALLFVVVGGLGGTVQLLHLPRFWSGLLILLPALHSYVMQRWRGPVRLQSKSDGTLVFWFRNPDYARMFEGQHPCSSEAASFARML